MKENILVAFSGGRTSAYMSWWLIENMSHLYNFKFVYANTGLEHEKTLEFVNKVDKLFNLNLTWVEADIKNGADATYSVVDFKSATRDNSLFKDMAKIYGLMNRVFIHCTRELKNRPIKKFASSLWGGDYRIALGIRHDEFHRVKNREDAIYPLATICKVSKKDVLSFWNRQPFDLDLDEHLGNCVGCYKKSDKKLKMIADECPSAFEPFIELENEFSFIKSVSEDEPRIIYRHFRTAFEVQNNLKLPNNMLDLDGCSGECGSVLSDFESPKQKDMILSKGLFD